MGVKKLCSCCEKIKPVSDFYEDRHKKIGLRSKCKVCDSKQAKKSYQKRRKIPGMVEKIRNKANRYYADHRDQARESRNRCKYGLEPGQRAILYADQNGCCLICDKTVPYNKIHTDHNHKTGEVRGLLCGNCNLMLGQAIDNVEILKAAIKYLEGRP